MIEAIVIWGCLALVAAIGAGITAKTKRRDPSYWAAWSFLFPGAILFLLALPDNAEAPTRPTLEEGDSRES